MAAHEGTKDPTRMILYLMMLVPIGLFGALAFDDFRHGDLKGGLIQLAAIVLVFVVCPIAWTIGDAARRFAMPSMYFAQGFVGLVKARIFWMIGPQCFATFLAVAALLFGATHIPGAVSEANTQPMPAEAVVHAAQSDSPQGAATSVPTDGVQSNCSWSFQGTKIYSAADRGEPFPSDRLPVLLGVSDIQITKGCYTPERAIDGCHAEFGRQYGLVDWVNVYKRIRGNTADFAVLEEATGLQHYNAAWVHFSINSGRVGFDLNGRHYFVVRGDGNPPPGFPLNEITRKNDVIVGSWNEFVLPSLCVAE